MRRREELPEAFIPASPEATASAMAGGQAYMADVAQRLAPYFARAESRHRAMA
jgi:SRSO17 transposase